MVDNSEALKASIASLRIKVNLLGEALDRNQKAMEEATQELNRLIKEKVAPVRVEAQKLVCQEIQDGRERIKIEINRLDRTISQREHALIIMKWARNLT